MKLGEFDFEGVSCEFIASPVNFWSWETSPEDGKPRR